MSSTEYYVISTFSVRNLQLTDAKLVLYNDNTSRMITITAGIISVFKIYHVHICYFVHEKIKNNKDSHKTVRKDTYSIFNVL